MITRDEAIRKGSSLNPDLSQSVERADVAARPYIEKMRQNMASRQEEVKRQATSSLGEPFDVSKWSKDIEGRKEEQKQYEEKLQASLSQNASANGQQAIHKEDSEPYGFDNSDKMSMIGALTTGGILGLAEGGARAVQLGLHGMEDLHLVEAGKGDKFTDWFNRAESRSKLVQEAIHSHPFVTELGKIGGGTIATGLMMSAAAGAGEAAAGVAGVAKIAKTISELAPEAKMALNSGAAKAILNSKAIGKAMTMAKVLGQGAFIGETQYDPENNHYISQGITGGIANLLIYGAGSTFNKLATPFGIILKDLAEKYNINLPVYPSLEKFAKTIPVSGFSKMIEERAGRLQEIGTGVAKKIGETGEIAKGEKNYADYLTGELKKNYDAVSKKIVNINNQIDEKVKDRGNITLSTTLKTALGVQKEVNALIDGLKDARLSKITDNLVDTLSVNPELAYKAFRDNMKEIGEQVGLSANANVKSQYGRLYNAMDEDLGNHLKYREDTLNLYNEQRMLYKERKLPFINGKFQAYRDDLANSDNFISKFLKPDSPMTFNEMIANMPKDTQAKAVSKAAIINSAMEDAHIEGVGINPMKFINRVMKYGKTLGVVFDKGELEALQGYQKLVQITQKVSPESVTAEGKIGLSKSSTALSNLHMKILGAIAGTGAAEYYGIPIAVIGTLAAAPIVFSRMVTSKVGRKFLSELHGAATNLTNEEVDNTLSKFINIISVLKTPAKIAAIKGVAKANQ